MDIFGPLLEIGKMIFTPISKCVKYHRGLDESMKMLQEKLEELNTRKTDIESQIKAEVHSRKGLKKEVEIWLQKVQKINDDKHLEQEVGNDKFFSRARLGRLAAKKILEVEQLRQRGSFSDGLMVDTVPGGGELLPTTTLIVGETTSERKMQKIWTSLIGEDVQKIGVYGMGGSGKTTIMKHIHNRVMEINNDTFDNVHWITVSKAISVIRLQDVIARALNFKGIEDIEDEAIRAAKIYQKLVTQKRCVLIFDDMWEAFNLESVGIPEPTIGNGCKLVLTTRSLDVCKRMNCLCIKMELLSNDEAWNLFLERVGRDLSMSPDLEAIAKLVAKECACLPLGIITIGTSMKGVVDKREWRNALKKLRKSTKGIDEMKKVIEQLKYSYTRLKDENSQRCLLYCALFPEDCKIERRELIRLLIVEEIIDGMGSRQEAFDEGHTILNKLENACLLESCSNAFGTKDYVKMHDVIRDMAQQIMVDKSMVEAGVQLREFPGEEKWNEEVETVSLMINKIEELLADAPPRCSKLKTLLLSKSARLKIIPDSLFMHMPNLCVLDLSYSLKLIELPTSISDLENLTALILRQCWSLYYVHSLAKLRRLRVLDLCSTAIEDVPQGMEMLVKLQYLNIYTRSLKTFPTGILPKLIQLQCLILTCGYDVKIKGEELACLKKLERLECQFYDLNDFNSYVSFLQCHHLSLPNCYDFHAGYGKIWDQSTEDEGMHIRMVQVHTGRSEREGEAEEYPIVLLPNNVENFLIEGDNVSSLSDVQVESWFNLDGLHLSYLDNLRVLVDRSRPLSHDTFSHLRKIGIYGCPKLKQLFTPELVPYFPNLESIAVQMCDGMEEFVAEEEEQKEGNHHHSALTITLPKLRSLKFTVLPQLNSIICRRGIIVCESIHTIEIQRCWKLKRLPLYLPLINGQPSPPVSLRRISVYNEEWWDSLEWDNPITKDVLQPFVKYDYGEGQAESLF